MTQFKIGDTVRVKGNAAAHFAVSEIYTSSKGATFVWVSFAAGAHDALFPAQVLERVPQFSDGENSNKEGVSADSTGDSPSESLPEGSRE